MKLSHLTTIVLLGLAGSLSAETLDMDKLIPALKQVESNNNANAVGDNGKAKGILQIWAVVVSDVNRVSKVKYTHDDAFDPTKAEEICRKYLALYCTAKRLGHEPTMEDASRIWNGGPIGHKKSATNSYWKKVSKALVDNA